MNRPVFRLGWIVALVATLMLALPLGAQASFAVPKMQVGYTFQQLEEFAKHQTGLEFITPITVQWVDTATLHQETARLFDKTFSSRQVAAEDHLLRAFRITYYHQLDIRSVTIYEREMWLGPLFDITTNHLFLLKPAVTGEIPVLEQMDILREVTIALLEQNYPEVPFDQFGLNSSDQVQAARLTWGSQVIAVQASYLKRQSDDFQQQFQAEQQDREFNAAMADKGTDFLIERLIMPFEGQIGYDYWQHAVTIWGPNGMKAISAHPSQTTKEYLTQQQPALLAATYQSAEPNLAALLPGWQPLINGQAWGEWQSVLMVNCNLPMGASEYLGGLQADSVQLWGKGQDTVMVWRTKWDKLEDFQQLQNSWWNRISFPPQRQDVNTTYAVADWEALVARTNGNSVVVILAPTKGLAEAILSRVAPN